MIGRGDYVILDKEDHASLVDGAKLSYGETKRFAHQDMAELERILERLPEDKGKLVCVDGLYSMEGDIAPLPELIPLCRKYGARLLVDDAHAIGVLGCGRGTGEHFHMTRDIDLVMSTFSKSFASLGGFIAGDEPVVHYIKHHARSLLFSASIPPSNAAAALASLKIMREEPERVEHLCKIADYMRDGYRRLGFNIGTSTTAVIPVILGEQMLTLFMWRRLFDEGVFVNPVLAPAVQPGRELLRTSYMATHTFEQMDRVLAIFEKVGKEMGVI